MFVLKLYECQIVKRRKLERVSITLMNRAIKQNPEQVDKCFDFHAQGSIGGFTSASNNRRRLNGKDYYGVQSDKNIWWMAAFELPYETTDSLRWYLNKTGISDIISLQNNGQTLHVEGIGEFTVEWHMARDLKTLKCMLGCKLGANTLFPCIYCCHSKSKILESSKGFRNITAKKSTKFQPKGQKQSLSSLIKTQKTDAKRPMQWVNGILSCDTTCPPNRNQEDAM